MVAVLPAEETVVLAVAADVARWHGDGGEELALRRTARMSS
jgi:hypothetical protein